VTGLISVHYGARRQYKEAYRFWHATELAKAEPDWRMTNSRRFPAPRIILGQRTPINDIDVVVVGNFANSERTYEPDVAQWKNLASAGLNLALAHWPSFDDAEADLRLPVRAAIASSLVEIIVPGEIAICKAAVFLEPDLLITPPSSLPLIQAERLYVPEGTILCEKQLERAERHFSCTRTGIHEGGLEKVLKLLSPNSQLDRA
jgi:hypothetical protein